MKVVFVVVRVKFDGRASVIGVWDDYYCIPNLYLRSSEYRIEEHKVR